MANYVVTWAIDVQDADSPEEAARQALEIQRDPYSTATVFEVVDRHTGDKIFIDLEEI